MSTSQNKIKPIWTITFSHHSPRGPVWAQWNPFAILMSAFPFPVSSTQELQACQLFIVCSYVCFGFSFYVFWEFVLFCLSLPPESRTGIKGMHHRPARPASFFLNCHSCLYIPHPQDYHHKEGLPCSWETEQPKRRQQHYTTLAEMPWH